MFFPACAWLVYYSWRIEPHNIEITRHEVTFSDLPEALDGLVLCQVSDVHLTAWERNGEAISRAVKSTRADLYLFTGDMIHRQGGIEKFLNWFDDLGISSAIAVLGNAEHKSHVDKSPLEAGLAQRSIPLLTNKSLTWLHDGVEFQIVGVDDPHTDHDDFELAYQNTNPALWTLLLCHSPDGAANLNGHRADLMLCGHTHGGQGRFPIVGAIAQNTKRVRGLVSGWYEGNELSRKAKCATGSTKLYISRGLGMSRLGFRINCRPELAVFTLRRQ